MSHASGNLRDPHGRDGGRFCPISVVVKCAVSSYSMAPLVTEQERGGRPAGHTRSISNPRSAPAPSARTGSGGHIPSAVRSCPSSAGARARDGLVSHSLASGFEKSETEICRFRDARDAALLRHASPPHDDTRVRARWATADCCQRSALTLARRPAASERAFSWRTRGRSRRGRACRRVPRRHSVTSADGTAAGGHAMTHERENGCLEAVIVHVVGR